MKKVYDWNLDVVFRIPKCSKTVLLKGLSIHTFVKELQIQICENLGLNPINAVVSFYQPGNKQSMKPQSTLYQHRVKNNEILICDVKSTINQVIPPNVYMQEQQLFDISEFDHYNPTQVQLLAGLVVRGFCSKRDCLDYNVSRNIALGYGVFDLNDILNHRACLQCGNKKFVLKELMVSNCNWKYAGRYINYDGTLRSDSKATFETINATNHSKSIYDLILKRRWVELALMIKQL